MEKLPVYCDFNYLQDFFIKLKESKLDIYGDDSELRNLSDFKEILLSKSLLLIDKTEKEIEELSKNDILLKTIIKRSTTGGSEIYSCSEEINKIKSLDSSDCVLHNEPSVIYCLSIEKSTANDISSKYGVFCFGQHDYPKLIEYRKEAKVIKKGQDFNWENILPQNHPSQFIIIHDNYLIENTTKENCLNFKKIIRSLITNSFKGDFKIVLLHFIEDETLLMNKQKIINEIISDMTVSCHICLSFKKGRKESMHDRDIITNYFWIHSGHTTDIEKNNISTKETTIHFVDIFNSTDSFLNFQKKIWNKLNN